MRLYEIVWLMLIYSGAIGGILLTIFAVYGMLVQ